jgi:hypothetical protein
MSEECSMLEKKVWQQLENEILQGWIYSEVKLSSRYEFLNKSYRFKLKNKIQKDRVNV